MPSVSSSNLLSSLELYRVRPDMFSEEDIDRMEKISEERGIPFSRNMGASENNLLNQVLSIPTQFSTGFLHGFTTIPVGPNPKGDIDGIARSLGHLIGFIGGVPGLGTLGSLTAKGIGGTARLARAAAIGAKTAKGAGKFVRAGEKLEKAAAVTRPFTSVPMYAAEMLTNKAGKSSAGRVVAKYLGDKQVAKQMVRHAAKLGTATTIASWSEAWHEGVDEFVVAGIEGAIFGGFFGALGNIPGLKGATTKAKVLRGIAGAAFQGLPSTLQGQTNPNQVYNYLLGAYFGAHAVSWQKEKASGFIRDIKHPLQQKAATTAEGFENLPKDVQSEVKLLMEDIHGGEQGPASIYNVLKKLYGNIWKKVGVDRTLKGEIDALTVGQIIGGTAIPVGTRVQILQDGHKTGKKMTQVRTDDGTVKWIKNENVRRPAEPSVETTEGEILPRTKEEYFAKQDKESESIGNTVEKRLEWYKQIHKEALKSGEMTEKDLRERAESDIADDKVRDKERKEDPIAYLEKRLKGTESTIKGLEKEKEADLPYPKIIEDMERDNESIRNILAVEKGEEPKFAEPDEKTGQYPLFPEDNSPDKKNQANTPPAVNINMESSEDGESRGTDAPAREPIKQPIMSFLEKLVGKKVSGTPDREKGEMGNEEYFGHLMNIQQRVQNKELTDKPGDWNEFKSWIKNLKQSITGDSEVSEEDFRSIRPFYIRQTKSVLVQRRRWDTNFGKFVTEEDFDAKGNRIDRKQPPTLLGEIAVELGLVKKPEDAYFEVRNVSGKYTTGMLKKGKTFQEKVGEHDWTDKWGQKDMIGMIEEARKDGYYLYSGKSSSHVFFFTKLNIGDGKQFGRIRSGFQSVYSKFSKDYDILEKNFIEKGWGTASQFQNEFISNVLYWETQNSLPIETLMTNYSKKLFENLPKVMQGKIKKAGIEDNWYSLSIEELTTRKGIGKKTAEDIMKVLDANKEETNPFLRSVLNFNKRQQPIFNTYYALDEFFFPDRLNYVVVKDYHRYLKSLGFDVESTDGGALIRDDILDAGFESQGLPQNGGFWKPFIVNRSSRGLMLGKLAFHGAGPQISAEMKRLGIEMILPESTMKQYGVVKFLEMQYGYDKTNTVKEAMDSLILEKQSELDRGVDTDYGPVSWDVSSKDVEKAYWTPKRGLVTRADRDIDLAAEEEAAARTHLGEFGEDLAREEYDAKRREWSMFEDQALKIDFLTKENKIVFSFLLPKAEYEKADVFDILYGGIKAVQERLNLSGDTKIVVKTNHTFKKPFNKISDVIGDVVKKDDALKLSFNRNGLPTDIKDFTYDMAPKDIKVSFGTYDTIPLTLNRNARAIKQLGDNLSGDQLPPEVARDYIEFLESRYAGDKEFNDTLRQILEDPKMDDPVKAKAALDRLLGENFENFSKLGLKVINDAMKENTPVGKEFRQRARLRMLRTSSEGMEDEYVEMFNEDGEDAAEVVSSAMRWLNISDGSDAMTFSKIAAGSWDRAIVSYFVKRIISPKIPYSSKGIMRMYDLGLHMRTDKDGPTANLLKDEINSLYTIEGKIDGKKVISTVHNRNLYYLDEGFRNLKIMGVTSAGVWRIMTLEGQWNIFKAEKAPPARQKMLRALNSVLVRTPMDDISGAANMYFGGFTGRKGGGVLLHPQVMKRLGGADLDIDSAFIYIGNHPKDIETGKRGLPETYFKALVDFSDSQDLNRSYIDKTYGGEEKLRELFIKDKLPVPLQDSPVSIFDPYSRMQTAYAVQQGTGKLMPVSVKARFMVRTFYKIVKDMPNSTYKHIMTSSRNKEIGSIEFIARRSEEDLRAKSSMAINMSADAAKYGQIISIEEMRAILIDSAFDQIVVRLKPGHPENKTKRTITHVIKLSSKNNLLSKTEDISPDLLEFVSTGIRKKDRGLIPGGVNLFQARGGEMTHYARISSFNSRLFGKNFTTKQSFTRNEKQKAGKDYLKMFSQIPVEDPTIMSMLGRRLIELDYTDSFFHRIRIEPQRWTNMFNRINNLITTTPGLAKYLPESWKDRKAVVPVKYYSDLITLLKSYYTPADGRYNYNISSNIATEAGIEDLALAWKPGSQFWHFFSAWKRIRLAHMSGSPGALKKKIADFEKKFSERNYQGWKNVEWRKQFIRDRLKEADDFASNDLWDIATIKTINDIGERYGINDAVIVVTQEWLDTSPLPNVAKLFKLGDRVSFSSYIFEISEGIRKGFDQFVKGAKVGDSDVSPLWSGFDGINKLVEHYKAALRIAVEKHNNELTPGASELSAKGTERFLEAALMGSIGRSIETETYRFAPMLASQPVLKLFGLNYRGIFGLYEKGSNRDAIKDFFNKNPLFQQVVEEGRQLEVLKQTWKDLGKPQEELEAVKLNPEMKAAVQDIVQILKSYPEFSNNPDAVMGILAKHFGIAKIGDLSSRDIIGMRDLLRSWKKGRGFFTWLTRKGGLKIFKGLREQMGDKLRVGWGMWMKPIENVANDHYLNDLKIIDERLPVATLTNEGKVRKVYVEAAVPMTHFHRLIDTMDKVYSLPNMVRAFDDERMQELLGWSQTLKDADGKDQAALLFELSWRQRERDGAIEWRNELKTKPHVTDVQMKHAEDEVETFVARVEEKYKEWWSIKDALFQVGEENVKGQDVIERIKLSLDEFVNDYIYDKKISLTDTQLRRYLVLKSNGDIDISKTVANSAERVFKHGVSDKPMTLNMARLLWYENYLENLANDSKKDGYKDLDIPTVQDVLNLKGIVEENSAEEKLFSGSSKDYIVTFLKTFYRFSQGDEGLTLLALNRYDDSGKYTISPKQAGYKDSLFFLVDEYWKGSEAIQNKMSEKFGTILNYMERRNKAVWKKGESYSQYDNDMNLARNRIDKKLYLKDYLRQGSGGGKTVFREIGSRYGYMPHSEFASKLLDADIMKLAERYEREGTTEEVLELKLEHLSRVRSGILGEENTPDGLISDPISDAMMAESRGVEQLVGLAGNKTFGNMLKRSYNFSGYSYDIGILDGYLWKLNRATYINMASLLAENNIRAFEKKAPMGKELTADWVWYMRTYVRDVMGYPSTFPEAMLESPTMTLKSTPYYWLSDQFLFEKLPRVRKAFITIRGMDTLTILEKKRLGNKLGHPPTDEEIKRAEKDKLELLTSVEDGQGKKNLDMFAYQLRALSQAEGKYAMATLLARLKTGVTNVFGGSTNTWVWVGAHNMRMARNIDVWTDINPNTDSKKGPVFKTMEDVHTWIKGLGVVEEMVIYEAGLIKKRFDKDKKVAAFVDEVTQIILKGKEVSDLTMKELWRKHGVGDKIGNAAAFAMRPTERFLRINSFAASYLQARESMFPVEFELNNPWLIQQGLKGVKATQFYYHAPYRSAFARTSAGKVYSRFKLWGWSSVKFRREVFQEAKYHGYKPGSQEFDRLQRLMIADALVLALANFLPYTMFDYGLPAPYAQLQDFAHWTYGDDQERDRAFYGVLPKYIAPLHEVMPSIMRLPESIFGTMFTGAWDRLAQYTLVSTVPFGLMSRDIARAIDNPSMAADFITGIPVHRLASAKKTLQKTGYLKQRGLTWFGEPTESIEEE